MITKSSQHIIILGSGISGLSTAFFASRKLANGSKITLIEASKSIGGWMCSRRTSKGTLLEIGPHSFRPVGQSGISSVKLIEELGLLDEALGTSQSSKQRYIWRSGKLHLLPSSIPGMFSCSLTKSVPWLALRNILSSHKLQGDSSVYDFISQRFSPYVAEVLIASMVSGIYAGDIRKLSIDACFPILVELERKHGSLVKGVLLEGVTTKPTMTLVDPRAQNLVKCTGVSFRNGMQTLTDTLKSRTFDESSPNGVTTELITGNPVISMDPASGVTLRDGRVLKADAIISTIPIRSLYPILPKIASEALSDLHTSTEYGSVAVVNVVYQGMERLPYPGFGHLIPNIEHDEILGAVFDSEVFPMQQPKGTSCISVMMGGMHRPEVVNMSSQEMVEVAVRKAREQLGIQQSPSETHAVCHVNAIPQFALHHRKKVALFREFLTKSFPGLLVIGNNFGGVGIADSIAAARTLVENEL